MGDDVLGISLLGAFSVTVGGRVMPEDAWRLRKAKTLIKLLALASERRLHVDQVAELLWEGRDQASARNSLHQVIFAARRAFDSAGLEGRDCLVLHEDVIALCPGDPVRIDVLAFEEAAASARARRDPAAYRDALDFYGGELLPEDRYEEWTASRRDAVHELRLVLGIELAELQAPEDPAAAIDCLRSVLAGAPLYEPAHRALMRLYVGGGRRQEALAQFQELKLGLRREFADEPDEVTRRLYREILTRSAGEQERNGSDAAAGGRRVDGRPAALPQQLTSFIGRERELAEAATLLGGSRLLTLTGAGGCGKTRLALELAGQRLDDFADGVWLVELAALGEPELLGPAVAQALDTRLASDRAPEVAVAGHIGDRQQLLLLDNCEHLIEAVAHLVQALLGSALPDRAGDEPRAAPYSRRGDLAGPLALPAEAGRALSVRAGGGVCSPLHGPRGPGRPRLRAGRRGRGRDASVTASTGCPSQSSSLLPGSTCSPPPRLWSA